MRAEVGDLQATEAGTYESGETLNVEQGDCTGHFILNACIVRGKISAILQEST